MAQGSAHTLRLRCPPRPRRWVNMFTFLIDSYDTLGGAAPTLFMAFFVYVWLLWTVKLLAARRSRPALGTGDALTTSVIVPVFREPERIFRRALASVSANRPTEL